MEREDWSLLSLAKRQQGVVSDEQAMAVGFTRGAIRWRLEVGEWTRVLPGVARMFWADDTWATRCVAAALWAGTEGALSHVTAALIHGFDVEPQPVVHLSTGRDVGRLRRRGFQSHQVTLLASSASASGLPVTTPARTVIDLASMLDEAELERVLGLALRHRQLTQEQLHDEFAKLSRGTSGAKQLRRVFKRLVRVQP